MRNSAQWCFLSMTTEQRAAWLRSVLLKIPADDRVRLMDATGVCLHCGEDGVPCYCKRDE